ncbi:hypothetical protein BayCH28_06665 [Mycolicibacterium sp. CH28]|uniref:DUF6159 family protein n=1 Tax=Mycolicibacterium sp. CH28 TaxID=2512237 RepID=UPI001081FC37|nr:DUF6159 family protein [Mycolicibacterium sp. CH28]TGD89054.1 hypothetical protein BayCH28_06665 [Mycolicibacterium sp. CH28]
MFESPKRGWQMTKASWGVLREHPKLAVFPVFSGIALIGVTAVLIIPTGLGALAGLGMELSDKTMQTLGYTALFVWYFLCTFVIVFCNAALVGCTMQSFAGQSPTIGSGFASAGKRLPQILGWSLVAATIGVILRLLDTFLTDKLGFIGELVGSIAAGLWGVATYFAVPVVVAEGVGPVRAVKRSSSILRRTWGESLGGAAGLGVITFLFLLPLLVLFPLAAVSGPAGQPLQVILVVVAALYVLAIVVVFTALGTIFRTAVYTYATTGSAPGHIEPALLQTTFRAK